MRRDMDLVRGLLLKLEEFPMRPGSLISFYASAPEIEVDDFSVDDIDHHLRMIYAAGFVDYGGDRTGGLDGSWYFRGLTWAGHDFVDAVREPKVWKETKSRAEKIGSWSIDLLAGLAKGYAKAKAAELGFPIG